ncbi:MAG: putative dsRNA-binding protein [Candidatus Hodarchaeales archaeon]|jgi:dsRNA-specific ribonuclease
MAKDNIIANLAARFQLSEEESMFKLAIHPKSCGGGEEFKFLALYGDIILNLILLDKISRNELKISGQITEALHSFHNEETLYHIAKEIKIDEIMRMEHKTNAMTKRDLKESVEALLGATYKIKGLESCKEIVANLIHLVLQNKFLNPNPRGILQVLFQKRNQLIPKYESKRVGGPDHQQLFQCQVKGEYEGEGYLILSDILPSKKEAEKDAAVKFLTELGEKELLETSFFRL